MNRKSFSLLLVVFIFVSVIAQSSWASNEAIKLDWISFVPRNVSFVKNFQSMFVDKVNMQAKGELFIRYRGGPDVIAAFDQGKAVQQGIVDIAVPPVG